MRRWWRSIFENKEGTAAHFKGGFGFLPMICFADATGETLAAELRPGERHRQQPHRLVRGARRFEFRSCPLPVVAALRCSDDPSLVSGPEVVRSDSAWSLQMRTWKSLERPQRRFRGGGPPPCHGIGCGSDRQGRSRSVEASPGTMTAPKTTRQAAARRQRCVRSPTLLTCRREARCHSADHPTPFVAPRAASEQRMLPDTGVPALGSRHRLVKTTPLSWIVSEGPTPMSRTTSGRMKDSGLERCPFTDLVAISERGSAWCAAPPDSRPLVPAGCPCHRTLSPGTTETSPLATLARRRHRTHQVKARGDMVRMLNGRPTASDIRADYRHSGAVTRNPVAFVANSPQQRPTSHGPTRNNHPRSPATPPHPTTIASKSRPITHQ